MTSHTQHLLLATLLSLTLLSPARASRSDKANSLSDCIAKADILFIGFVDEKRDEPNGGVIRVRVLGSPLKGELKAKELTIADPHFHSTFAGPPEGPIVVHPRQAYIFFLAAPTAGQYRPFNSYDGIVLPCPPVTLEIRNQLKRPTP